VKISFEHKISHPSSFAIAPRESSIKVINASVELMQLLILKDEKVVRSNRIVVLSNESKKNIGISFRRKQSLNRKSSEIRNEYP